MNQQPDNNNLNESKKSDEAAKPAAPHSRNNIINQYKILNDVPDSIIIFNNEGVILGINKNAEICFGYYATELIGQKITHILQDVPTKNTGITDINDFINNSLEGRIELTAKTKHHSLFLIELSLSRHQKDPTLQNDFFFIAIIRDISSQKQIETLLKTSKERFDLAVSGSNDGIWDWDIVNKTIYFSSRFKELLGYKDHEFPNTSEAFYEILSPYDKESMRSALRAHLKEHKNYDTTYRLRTKKGSYKWFHAKGKAVWENGMAVRMAGSISDISEIKDKERELETATQKALESNRIKSDFLANMSHEIRTPMNGIIGMTSLLNETKLDTEQKQYTSTIQSSAETLLEIINDILDLSKIEAGKLDLEIISFNLELLAEDIFNLMAVKCQDKGLELILKFPPNVPRFVKGDPVRIRQIITNLIANAIKFTESGHIMLAIDAKKLENSKNGEILIDASVQDTGIGIPLDKQDLIFNKFDQADSSTTRKFGGTGLGLAICKQLTKMMSGDIGVTSILGEGSTFWFNIKITEDTSVLANLPAPNNHKILENKRILVIDDSHSARIILKEHISSMNMLVDTANNAKQAIEKLSAAADCANKFDIAIIDYQMPHINGQMLAKMIKSNPKIADTILVMVTSSPSQGDGKKMRELGFSGYLTKPTFPSHISNVLSIILNAKECNNEIGLVTKYTIKESFETKKIKLLFKDVNLLLAEDNVTNQMVATSILEKYGIKITLARNGNEAINKFKEQYDKSNLGCKKYDIILMDCQMPQIDGYEATKAIRTYEMDLSDKPHMPIVALTANAMQGDREKCFESGMDDYVTKPIVIADIEKILIKWLPHKQLIQKPEDPSVSNAISSQKNHAVPTGNNVNRENVLNSNYCEIINIEIFENLKEILQDKIALLAEKYVENLNIALSNIELGLQKNDQKLVCFSAHTMKSTSEQIGALYLGALFKKLEELIKQNNWGLARLVYNDIKTLAPIVKKHIYSHL